MLVVVLHDAVDPEAAPDQADGLVQAQAVLAALAGLGHHGLALEFSLNLDEASARLAKLAPEAVFNLSEAPGGQGRFITLAPALLESLGLAYTGNRLEATFLTSNKVAAKRALQAAGLPTPTWLGPAQAADPRGWPGAWIVKSRWEHASLGLEDDALVDGGPPGALALALAHRAPLLGLDCFAEAFVVGREFNLSLIAGQRGPEVLPPAEIDFSAFPPGKPRLVGYRAKWEPDSFEYRHTPRRFDFPEEDQGLLESLQRLALDCWRLFGLEGYARVDFRVDDRGQPWVLEVNTNPCLSPDAGFAAAAARAGLDMPALVDRLLEAGLGRLTRCARRPA